jgi:mevalonate kinase
VSLRSYLFVQVKHSSYEPIVSLNFPDIKLHHAWLVSELPYPGTPSSTPPSSLRTDLLEAIDPLLEPFAKNEIQHTAVLAFFYLYLSLSPLADKDVSFLLRSAIPIGSGLGSSASISVCLAAALLTMGGKIPDPASQEPNVLTTINNWAFLGEKCLHGNPSGVDNTVATFGGGVVFRKERRERKLSNGTFTPSKPAEKIIIKYTPLDPSSNQNPYSRISADGYESSATDSVPGCSCFTFIDYITWCHRAYSHCNRWHRSRSKEIA